MPSPIELTDEPADDVRVPFRPDWGNISFLATAHLVGIGSVVYIALGHASWWSVGLGFVWFFLAGLGITGGYHRLFAHRAYTAHPLVRAFYLLFGAAAVQNSALKWSSDHRLHHAKTDTERDPYNIRRGFFWAHVGWVLSKEPPGTKPRTTDLTEDPLVRFQDKHFVACAVFAAVVLPFCFGLIWGDPVGAVLIAGFLRLVVQWHATFFVNSLAHCVGTQPYGTRTTARDSFIVAIATLGEGYHNFHHTFPTDYRNGVRWYHFDPTKWVVWGLSRVGLTGKLKRVPDDRLQKARDEAAARQRAA